MGIVHMGEVAAVAALLVCFGRVDAADQVWLELNCNRGTSATVSVNGFTVAVGAADEEGRSACRTVAVAHLLKNGVNEIGFAYEESGAPSREKKGSFRLYSLPPGELVGPDNFTLLTEKGFGALRDFTVEVNAETAGLYTLEHGTLVDGRFTFAQREDSPGLLWLALSLGTDHPQRGRRGRALKAVLTSHHKLADVSLVFLRLHWADDRATVVALQQDEDEGACFVSLQETGLPEAGLVGIELGVDQSVVPDLSLSRLWIDFAGAENGPLTGTEQLELQGIPHWSWTGASALPQAVSVEDLGQIRELAGQVHAAFASADVVEIVGLMSTKLDDFAKISGDRAGGNGCCVTGCPRSWGPEACPSWRFTKTRLSWNGSIRRCYACSMVTARIRSVLARLL